MRKNSLRKLFSHAEREPLPKPIEAGELTVLWCELTAFGVAPDRDVSVFRKEEAEINAVAYLADFGHLIEVHINDPEWPDGINGQRSFRVLDPKHYPEYLHIVAEHPDRAAKLMPTRQTFEPLLDYLHDRRTSPEYRIMRGGALPEESNE